MGDISYIIYHGSNRIRDVRHLQKYNVVITTYNILSQEYIEPEDLGKKKKSKKRVKRPSSSSSDDSDDSDDSSDSESDASSKLDQISPLYKISWGRVILDEGHVIREWKTLTSRACCALPGVRRWVLTGTPFQNKINDLYALLHFIQVQPFSSHRFWSSTIVTPLKQKETK